MLEIPKAAGPFTRGFFLGNLKATTLVACVASEQFWPPQSPVHWQRP